MAESGLDKACAAFKRATHELHDLQTFAPHELATRLRSMSHSILDALGEEDDDSDGDIMTRLQRSSHEIADDLKRVENLMKRNVSGEDDN